MKPIIRIIALLFIALCFTFHSSLGQETDTKKNSQQTRSLSVPEAIPKDSIFSSPLLNFAEHIRIQKSIAQYQIVYTEALKMLQEKGKPENLFWKSWFCVYQTAILTLKNQENAVTLMSPVFILIFILVFLYPTIKTFFFKPYLVDAEKPTNAAFYAELKKKKKAIDEEDLEVEDENAYDINENNEPSEANP